MPTLTLPDIELYYETEGAGPPLLMIPGLMSDSASWLPVVEPLARHFTLIRPDPRTTGRTRPLDAETSIETVAADCAALLDHLGHAQAHILGHSMGGLVALTLAQQAPDRVQSLTLAASAPLRLARTAALFDALTRLRETGTAPDLWLRLLFPWLFRPQTFDSTAQIEATVIAALAYPHAQSPAAMRRQLDAFRRFDPIPLRATPPAPTLALLAEDDMLLPAAAAEPVLRSLGAITLETLPNTGHSLHWDAPEEFVIRVTAFLQRQAAR